MRRFQWRCLSTVRRWAVVGCSPFCQHAGRGFGRNWPKTVRIVEVGPRDGLQNEQFVPTAVKLELINRLAETGLRCIEATSFVSAKRVPQLADHERILSALSLNSCIKYPVLVPNLQGLMLALESGARDIAVFVSASEAFSRRNINCSIDESFARLGDVFSLCKERDISVRGYISCVLGCPYTGFVEADTVRQLALRLLECGCKEVSLGDTIGVGTAGSVARLLALLLEFIPAEQLAVHFHDTYGQALANVLVALSMGISTVDSSVAGLGGCPFAASATGNLATEDLLYMLDGLGVSTGVKLEKLVDVSLWICDALKRARRWRNAEALWARRALFKLEH